MIKNKNNLIVVIGFIIGIIISATGVYAATIIGKGSDLTYSNTSSGLSSTNIQGSLDELYKYKENLNCPEGKVCLKQKNSLALGDYVKMTPTKSSYTTDTSKTGCDSTQTINPQKLNLWRVIAVNDDGTIDIISDQTGPSVCFKGTTGIYNYIGYLNVLASQYENSTYTVGSRHFGYNGQVEYGTDSDVLYKKDYNLLDNSIGLESSDGNYYWIASRSSSSKVKYMDEDYVGEVDIAYSTSSHGVRPILTLKSGLNYSGSGTETDPYVLP